MEDQGSIIDNLLNLELEYGTVVIKLRPDLAPNHVKQIKKLVEVQSMHEQREYFNSPCRIVKKGVWIEILNFNPDTEQVDIKHRWEVEKVEEKIEDERKKYKVTCKVLDIDKIDGKKKKIAKKVLKKHAEILKASFAKCLVDGIDVKTIATLKGILIKLGGKPDGNKRKDNK